MSNDSAVLEAKIKATEEGVTHLRQARAKAKQAFEASTSEQRNSRDNDYLDLRFPDLEMYTLDCQTTRKTLTD